MSIKNPFTILRLGLAMVFLANAIAAWSGSAEFRDILENSFVVHLFPAVSTSTMLYVIAVNDSLLTLIFLFNLKIIKYALIWASLWLIGVMVATHDLGGTLEHLGFLSMAIALYLTILEL